MVARGARRNTARCRRGFLVQWTVRNARSGTKSASWMGLPLATDDTPTCTALASSARMSRDGIVRRLAGSRPLIASQVAVSEWLSWRSPVRACGRWRRRRVVTPVSISTVSPSCNSKGHARTVPATGARTAVIEAGTGMNVAGVENLAFEVLRATAAALGLLALALAMGGSARSAQRQFLLPGLRRVPDRRRRTSCRDSNLSAPHVDAHASRAERGD